METWEIKGPNKLSGEVKIHGNKNSTFPCIAASLLLKNPEQSIILGNVPQIKDVFVLIDVIKYLGIDAIWLDENTLKLSPIENFKIDTVSIPDEIMAKIRGSVVLLGPLIAKFKSFSLPRPGGDKIGSRPLTAHILAFRDLGFSIEEKDGGLFINQQEKFDFSKNDPFNKKRRVWLTERSVTATESLLLFSSSLNIDEELTIYGAACEPHIMTICKLLSKMGAEISGENSNCIKIKWPNGVHQPSEKFMLDDDHIEAATYAVAAAITKSDVVINFKNSEFLELMDRYLKWVGVKTTLNISENKWSIFGSKSNFEISPDLKVIKAEPWPGFPTDAMSLFLVLATQCHGSVKFLEYMYEDRFTFVQILKDMGARIEENPPHVIKVHGPTPLSGQETFVRPDIRSGAALLLASLCAKGSTTLHDKNNVIGRGYEKLPETLISLGADIENK